MQTRIWLLQLHGRMALIVCRARGLPWRAEGFLDPSERGFSEESLQKLLLQDPLARIAVLSMWASSFPNAIILSQVSCNMNPDHVLLRQNPPICRPFRAFRMGGD